MLNNQLIKPKSIAVIGGSNDIQKPGGKVLKNLIDGDFQGDLYVVNPKIDKVQGIRTYRDAKELPETELAILAIAAKYCLRTIEILTQFKNTKAFIILSAGFSEENKAGAALEKRIVQLKIPEIEVRLADQIVDTINNIRDLDLKKRPCISETIDWAKALMVLQVNDLSPDVLSDTLNVICKYQVDTVMVRDSMTSVFQES